MRKVSIKAKAARSASIEMSILTTEQKNQALNSIAEAIWQNKEAIQKANHKDISMAKSLLNDGKISEAILQRLKLDEVKIVNIMEMVRSVASLEDPVGKTEYAIELDKGLELYRVSSPIGVIGVVFESRPDALPQIASLCLKSGNAVLMKGGSEAHNSNQLLYSIIKEASTEAGIPEGWIQLLEARDEVAKLLDMDDYVDLIIPRGSNNFVRYIQKNTQIPVLGHSEGICYIYIDRSANLEKAVEICFDAKVQYSSVCNAVDTLLIHKDVAKEFLPVIVDRYIAANVEVRGDPESIRILDVKINRASEADWGSEYLSFIVAVKVVENIDDAIEHINQLGSHHTDAIIAEDDEAAFTFLGKVDSASVFWNASTRFSDGYRYGLGAEVGISTGKIHARGPTGLEGLTIYKYYLLGSGQIVKSYVGENAREFTHRALTKKWIDIKKEYAGK